MTAECTCLPYCAGGDGPEEDCPVHGRETDDPARCAHLPSCTHGYNGTATFGWRDGCSRFIRADDRVIVSASLADAPVVRDMYDVRDRCTDLIGAFHAKKWSDR